MNAHLGIAEQPAKISLTLSYIYTTLSKTNCTGIKYTKYKVEQQVSLHQKDERDEGTISARGGFYLPYRIPTPSCSGSK